MPSTIHGFLYIYNLGSYFHDSRASTFLYCYYFRALDYTNVLDLLLVVYFAFDLAQNDASQAWYETISPPIPKDYPKSFLNINRKVLSNLVLALRLSNIFIHFKQSASFKAIYSHVQKVKSFLDLAKNVLSSLLLALQPLYR